MFAIPWYAVIFVSIPETLLIIGIGFALFNIKLNLGRSVFAGILIAILSYFLRKIMIPPGVHTIILVLALTAAISFLCKIKIWYSFVSVLLGAMIIGVIEDVFISLIFQFTSKTINDLAANPWLNISAFMPTLMLAILFFILIKRSNYVLYDLNMRQIN